MLRLILYIYSQLFESRLPKLRAYIYVSSFGVTLQWFWPELVFFNIVLCLSTIVASIFVLLIYCLTLPLLQPQLIPCNVSPTCIQNVNIFFICLSTIVTSIFLFLLSIYCFTSPCLRPELVYPYIVLRRPTTVSIRKYFLLSV